MNYQFILCIVVYYRIGGENMFNHVLSAFTTLAVTLAAGLGFALPEQPESYPAEEIQVESESESDFLIEDLETESASDSLSIIDKYESTMETEVKAEKMRQEEVAVSSSSEGIAQGEQLNTGDQPGEPGGETHTEEPEEADDQDESDENDVSAEVKSETHVNDDLHVSIPKGLDHEIESILDFD